jgi:hypothetical protein
MTLDALSAGTRISPTARNVEDPPQESWDLARTGTNRRGQTLNAWRQLPSAPPFGVMLKAPQGPGRVP